MHKLPILNIAQFTTSYTEGSFYANSFDQHLEQNHKNITIPHKHDFYLAVLFTEGTGTHEIDFSSHNIKPGSVFVLKPGQTHNWKFSKPPNGYIFFHSSDFYESHYTNRNLLNFPFFYSSQNPQCFYLKNSDLDLVTNYFERIINCFTSETIMKSQQLCSLIDLIYIELSRHNINLKATNTFTSKSYIDKVHQLEQLIEIHYKTHKLPRDYARLMHITTKHLNRITKETIGKTASALITERIILEAKRLLIYSKNSYSETAWDLGYPDYAYFSRLFKSKTGVTPSQFQKEQLKR